MKAANTRPNRHHVRVPLLTIDTAEGIRIRTEIAGVGSRLGAALLDLIVVVASYLVFLLLLFLTKSLLDSAEVGLPSAVPDFILGLLAGGFLLIVPLYFILFHMFWNGQTPGKRSVGIRVVAAHGAPASTAQFFLRGFLWPLDAILFVPAPIGLMLIALTPRCRRLGDMAGGTLVLSESRSTRAEEPWPEETWSAREDKTLDLSLGMSTKLDAEDVLLLRDSICRRDVPAGVRSDLYGKLLRHYAEKLNFKPGTNVRSSLKELYLFARETRVV